MFHVCNASILCVSVYVCVYVSVFSWTNSILPRPNIQYIFLLFINFQIKNESPSLNQMHVNDTNSDDDSFSDDDSPKRRRDLLTRRPSYHRILKDITGPDIAGNYKCTWPILLFLFFSFGIVYHFCNRLSIIFTVIAPHHPTHSRDFMKFVCILQCYQHPHYNYHKAAMDCIRVVVER